MTRTLESDASTIRHWLLGRRDSEQRLAQLAKRSRWTDAEYAAAFERALRMELIEYDVRSKTWGAARCAMWCEVIDAT
jgi:hypothetical protein